MEKVIFTGMLFMCACLRFFARKYFVSVMGLLLSAHGKTPLALFERKRKDWVGKITYRTNYPNRLGRFVRA
jgi:hypothetical protein